MAAKPTFEHKSAHRLAFDHYLRTGQRLTAAEWLDRHERKFNPYHDERGRFTSPPGVTVSWGAQGQHHGQAGGRRSRAHAPSVDRSKSSSDKPLRARSGVTPAQTSQARYHSPIVRDVAVLGTPTQSYRELNLRQAGLDSLRGSIAKPTKADLKDLNRIQAGYDANRRALDEAGKNGDREAVELLRINPVADFVAGGVNISLGKADIRDYFAVASAIPVASAIRYVRGVPQISGSLSSVTKIIKDLNLKGLDRHRDLSVKAMDLGGLVLPPSLSPITAVLKLDHMQTGSWGRSADSELFRRHQAKFIDRMDLNGAAKMSADDLDEVGRGVYSVATEENLKYVFELQKRLKGE